VPDRPNIVLILNDDMGYSDIGCYGGEVHTPHLDGLARGGIRFTSFYNTARCCPSRASLLTGLHPHQTGVGHMMTDFGHDGYRGDLNDQCVTIAEALKAAGYATYMSGKWHVTRFVDEPKHNWPLQRGFDRFYGTITGAGNYFNPNTLTDGNERIETPPGDFYYTDVISDRAAQFIAEHEGDQPFFTYVAYTAPHWPLHALPEDMERYKGKYDCGWDTIRRNRLMKMNEMGITDDQWLLSPRDERVPKWEDAPNKEWEARRMEVYAAQIDRMDQGIGRIVDAIRARGELDNTLILFLADNGGCAEEIAEGWRPFIISEIGREFTRDGRPVQIGNDASVLPGGEETYQSCGVPWANVSNTPFRLYKHWVHEGGISTPLIAHWPDRIRRGFELREQPGQLPDIMATCLDVSGAEYPSERNGVPIPPCEGFSLAPLFDDEPNGREFLVWEHEGNAAVRKGNWKLVRKYPGEWELYDMERDRSELFDVVAAHPEVEAELSAYYEAWAERCNVAPWEDVLEAMRKRREDG